MRFVNISSAAGILMAGLLPVPSRASIIFSPTPSYVNGTNLVTFADPDESMLNSISDGHLTIGFSSPMRASTVGDDWASWGSPPNTESSTPRVLWSGQDASFDPITAVTFTLSQPVTIFGFEAEPGPTDIHTLTATFFMAGQLEQTIVLDVSGNGGALLFAAAATNGTSFDSVTLTSDADFAVGQVRYATPEPASWGLIAAGLLFMFAISRKHKALIS